HVLTPRSAQVQRNVDFFPALVTTDTGNYLPASSLMMDEYCKSCHADVHSQWAVSAHRFASFNNPAYAFAVNNTRAKVLERDGNVHAARFCAGCHDPVPLLTGAFDDPEFDVVNDVTAHAGITCITCHGITEITGQHGNASYLIGEPHHYPFARSNNAFLRWVNGILIKGKPSFHKRTFLKPLHQTPEFCGTCHKVHLPEELNAYKWLRGQNHYDSFLLSGVSGHGVASFYYPSTAEGNCNGCHMKLIASNDFGAKLYEGLPELAVKDHQFPAANTALPYMVGIPIDTLDAHREFLRNSLRVDIFAIRRGDKLEEEPVAPLNRSEVVLEPGQTYVIDVVLRTLKLGHKFTEGTSDSNQVWLEVQLNHEGLNIASSGAMDSQGVVDPSSHFVNAYVLDRFGNRISERNAEDIFTKLYDHQINPGSASVVHYRLRIPDELGGTLGITATLNYRKFDTTFLRAFQGDETLPNDLPITAIAKDSVELSIGTAFSSSSVGVSPEIDKEQDVPEWIRWNDYGIGWLTKPNNSALRQAEYAFRRVSDYGRGEGHLNSARTLLKEGRLDEAAAELQLAEQLEAYPWSVAWFSGLIDLQLGQLDEAIRKFNALVRTEFTEARSRGFDFSLDYRLRNTLARAYFERSKLAESESDQMNWLNLSINEYKEALQVDPENVSAHYGLATNYSQLENLELEARHRSLHDKYRVDDNARDRALAEARRNDPIADRAANDVVIYDLQIPPGQSRN
ncbi:MAG: multiheme c-type cytochrome, partial [Gammaproteobacteria bacterium]|nr:multiheme c-type cytochrome [Gammaproteobacteria bacterium]